MKSSFLPIASLALVAACTTMSDESNTTSAQSSASTDAKARAHSEKVMPFEVQRATLDNGLRVVMIPMQSDGLVAYWSVVRTGSRDEVEEGVTGFAHFFEHMMFRGTKKNPGPVYDHIVNGMGADANAFTSDDLTCFHLSVSKDDLPKVIEIEADRFQNLDYPEQQFKTESGAVYGEYRKGRSSPFSVLEEAVREKAFDAHTYKHTTIGFEADIKRMPEHYAYSKTFFQRFYRPENVVVLVTGDFDPKSTLETIRKEYGGWKKGYQAPKIPTEPPQTAQRRLDVPFYGQTHPLLALEFKGAAFAPGDRQVAAASLIGELAFGETSPLYKKLVLDEQKLEMLRGDFEGSRDPGLWSVDALVKTPADVPVIERELWSTIADLQKNAVTSERLNAVRSHLRYRFLARMSTPDQVAQSTSHFIALTGDVAAIDQMFATLAFVTPEDVKSAAAKWLRPENCTVAILHTKGQEIPTGAAMPREAGDERTATGSPEVPSSARFESVDVRPGSNSSYVGRDVPGTPQAGSDQFFGGGSHNSKGFAFRGVGVNRNASGLVIRDALGDTLEPALSFENGVVSQKPVLLPVASDPLVSFKIWFQVGSQDDPAGKEGLAALTGALISEGATKSNAYDQVLQKLFPMAAGYSANVDKEMTVVSGTVHKDNLLAYYPLLIDAITAPAFDKADFDRLRDDTVSGIENQLRFASGEELGKATLYERIFRGTPYAHIGSGTVASLKRLTIEDVRQFWWEHYTRDNVVIGIGGGYPSDLPDRMKHDLGALAAGKPAVTPAPTPEKISGRDVVLVDNKSAIGSSISFGVPIAAKRGTKEFYALWIANSWLGEHRNSSSHLYNVIREERGINYGDYSYVEAYPRGGQRSKPPTGVGRRAQLFEVWIRTVPTEKTLFSLRAGLREVEHLAANGLTQEQFDFTKRFLKGYVLHFAESTADRLGYAIDDRYFGVDGHLAKFRKMMNEVTLDDVNSAVKKYMKVDDVVIAIVAKDAEGLKTALASGEPSPIAYGKGVEKSAEILSQDKEIESWPLKISADRIHVVPVQAMFEDSGSRPTLR